MKFSSIFRIFVWPCLLVISSLVFAGAEDLKTIPMDGGLPVKVKASISFLEINTINENEGSFVATVDKQLTWVDRRLSYDPSKAPRGFMEYRNEAATQRLEEIWQPKSEYMNLIGEPISTIKDLRIFPNGTVNYLQRMEAKFGAEFDLINFPYDTQQLSVKLISRVEPLNRVIFAFSEPELMQSNSFHPSKIDGWNVGDVSLKTGFQDGLRGTKYSLISASIKVKRQPFVAIATIIIPLLCCLLIPLLVLWLNTLNSEEHEGFGMSNTEIACFPMSGIFAVVALNFTVVTGYAALGHGDNPVVRLFGLNYIMLGLSFLVSIVLYRYYLVKRFYGRYVQDEFFAVLCWATPILCFGVTAAILALANVGV